MSWKTEKAFDLEKIGLEILSENIESALTHFKDNPRICWTQIPMEKPLWEKLKIYVEKEIPKEVTRGSLEESYKCPSCKSDRHWKDGSHCKDCGQKLKWNH